MKILNELTLDELRGLAKHNTQFADAVYDDAYENNMFWLKELSIEMLGERKGIRYYDNHSSFYFKLTDTEEFLGNLPDTCRDYLTEAGQELYDTAMKLKSEWDDMTYDEQQDNDEHYERMEDMAKGLLASIEDSLHKFESVSDDDIDGILDGIIDGIYGMSEWKVDDDGVVYQEIIKEYK